MKKLMRNPFLPQSLIFETIATEDLANVEILDGKWENLTDTERQAVFRFNVQTPSTDGSPPQKDTCEYDRYHVYMVSFGGWDRKANGVSISFYRCDSTADVGGGFGNQVFLAVQKAIYDYIKARKPYALSWSPVRKSSTQEKMRKEGGNARGRVYEMLSRAHLFPEYVSYKENHWIRKDLYDKFAVPEGLPKLSDDISKSSTMLNKVSEIKRMRHESKNVSHETISNINDKIYNFGIEDLAREKEELLKNVIDDPEQNPNKLRINDLVHLDTNYPTEYQDFVNDESSHISLLKYINSGRDYGKIVDMSLRSVPWTGGSKEMLLGKVFLVDQGDDAFDNYSNFTNYYVQLPLRILEKFKPEIKSERTKQRFKKLLDDAIKNPLGLDYGTEVIFLPIKIILQEDRAFGDIFKIKRFYDSSGSLYYEAEYVKNYFINQDIDENFKKYFAPTDIQTLRIDEDITNYGNTWNGRFLPLIPSTIDKAERKFRSFIETAKSALEGDNFFKLKKGDQVVGIKGDLLGKSKIGFRYGQIGRVADLVIDDGVQVHISWRDENALKDMELYQQVYKNTPALSVTRRYHEQDYDDAVGIGLTFQKLSDEAVEKAKSNLKNEYQKEYLDFVENPAYNPEKIKVGDTVFATYKTTNFARCMTVSYFGVVSKVESIDVYPDQKVVTFNLVVDKTKTASLMPQEISLSGFSISSYDFCIKLMHYNPANVLLHKKLAHMFDIGKDVFTSRSDWQKRFQSNLDGQQFQQNQKVKVAAGWKTDGTSGQPFVGYFYRMISNRLARVMNPDGDFEGVRIEKMSPVGKPDLRRNLLQQIQSSSLSIGDAVKVSKGMHVNKLGHIVNYSPKKGFAGYYVIVKTMPSDNAHSERIVVNADDLVPSDEVSKLESYKTILNRMNRYFEWKKL